MCNSNGDEKRGTGRWEEEERGWGDAEDDACEEGKVGGGESGEGAKENRELTVGGGGFVMVVTMASLTKWVLAFLRGWAGGSMERPLEGGPIGCVALETSPGAIVADEREVDDVSVQLNHRISRVVLLQSLMAFRGTLNAAIISEGDWEGGGRLR